MTEGSLPVTDAATTTDAATPSPFTMVAGDPAAMVCEGDVCYVPGLGSADGA